MKSPGKDRGSSIVRRSINYESLEVWSAAVPLLGHWVATEYLPSQPLLKLFLVLGEEVRADACVVSKHPQSVRLKLSVFSSDQTCFNLFRLNFAAPPLHVRTHQ